jgi:RHS repeat-associated protein
MSTALRTYYGGRKLVTVRNEVAGQSRIYHFDHQGTTQCLTDQTGAVTDRFACDAWGVQVKRAGNSINRQWYVGKLGYYRAVDCMLDYVRARWYSPYTAQWISIDHYKGHGDKYHYVVNRPVVLADASGLAPCRLEGSILQSWIDHEVVWGPRPVGNDFEWIAKQTHRLSAKVVCGPCPCNQAPPDPNYVFWQYVFKIDYLFDPDNPQLGPKWRSLTTDWYTDLTDPNGTPLYSPYNTHKKGPPSKRPLGGGNCDFVFEYEACDAPGFGQTQTPKPHQWGCAGRTYVPVHASRSAVFTQGNVRKGFIHVRQFCATIGPWSGIPTVPEFIKSETAAWNPPHLISWGVDYGMGHPAYPQGHAGDVYRHPPTWSGPCVQKPILNAPPPTPVLR